MDAFQAIVLGIVQGLTEYLPVSSTGHLRVVSSFMGWKDPGTAFTAVCQLGTMIAVLIYFREDLLRIARTWLASLRRPELRGDPDARMGWYIGLGTVPIGICGIIFKDAVGTVGRDLYLIGTALIVFSLLLMVADARSPQSRHFDSIGGRDALLIGVAQAFALIPGVSRSGATLTAGRFLALDRTSAARYSFLLSVPAVVLSGLFELRKIGDGDGAAALPTFIATVLAFIVGYVSIAFLLRWLASHSVWVFVAYRLALGAAVLSLAAAGAIS